MIMKVHVNILKREQLDQRHTIRVANERNQIQVKKDIKNDVRYAQLDQISYV